MESNVTDTSTARQKARQIYGACMNQSKSMAEIKSQYTFEILTKIPDEKLKSSNLENYVTDKG